VSEVILQQTQVSQGIEYYYRFLKIFPTINDLAVAPIEDVLKIWQGLAYYSRARNMHKAANSLLSVYDSVFPRNVSELKKLKGIGEYTAAAIASIAFNKPYSVVDGNVYRVLSRFFGIDLPIDNNEGKKYYLSIADKILDRDNPGCHNQALMELGAIICLPKNALCTSCPIALSCYAKLNNLIDKFPRKKKKIILKDRYFNYIVIRKKNNTFIMQRSEGDIWALLFQFPVIETEKRIFISEIYSLEKWKKFFEKKVFEVQKISKEFKHCLSHQIIHVQFIEVRVNDDYALQSAVEIEYKNLNHYAIPRLIDQYLRGSY
jgi:A/G-specific adenine glycosylase